MLYSASKETTEEVCFNHYCVYELLYENHSRNRVFQGESLNATLLKRQTLGRGKKPVNKLVVLGDTNKLIVLIGNLTLFQMSVALRLNTKKR